MADPLRTADFDYHLPDELIASRPLERRDASRMMVVDRASGEISHRQFADFPELACESLVALNDTRVARARFFSNDGRTELLRLEAVEDRLWKCLVRPGKRMRVGDKVEVGAAVGTVEEVLDDGARLVRWSRRIDDSEHGHLALPHYMKREDDEGDAERYQTVFARPESEQAIAAPTAGLHFTPQILKELNHAFVTLHVGVGTFQPVRAALLKDHVMHTERFEVTPAAAASIESAPKVLAVGTTVTRVLEHLMAEHGAITPGAGRTNIFIYPGFKFRRVTALLTNFHLPKSTLFMLVCAFGRTALLKRAYAEAVKMKYRFYSYGDCMLIL